MIYVMPSEFFCEAGMFRFLIVLVEIAVLVMLLRTSFVQYMLEDIQQDVTEIFTEISLKFEQTQLNDLRLSLQPQMAYMRDFQKDYIMKITSSKANLKQFHSAYCDKKEVNPYVNGANLSIVCHAIVNAKVVDTQQREQS
jgi:histidinol dehydrogenase